jgi:putative endonuclease
MYYLYILSLNNESLYKGITLDLRRRTKEHQLGKVASTRNKRPLKLIHYEGYLLKSDAIRREKFLKTTEGRRLLRQQLRDILNKKGGGSPGHTTGRPVE